MTEEQNKIKLIMSALLSLERIIDKDLDLTKKIIDNWNEIKEMIYAS